MSFLKNLLFISCFFSLTVPLTWAADRYERVGENELAFFTYKPFYFGYTAYHKDSRNRAENKYQLSFKYEVFTDSSWYASYTHKSLWRAQDNADPKKETDLTPEIFYGLETDSEGMPYVQFGLLKHTSNGEEKATELYWNTHYIEPLFKIDDFTVRLTIWMPFLFQSEGKATGGNQAIFDYYGNGEIELSYNHENGDQHDLLYREGKESGVYALRYQYNMNIDNFIKGLDENGWNTTLLVQFFNGYGETLSAYNVNTTRVLVGISIVH